MIESAAGKSKRRKINFSLRGKAKLLSIKRRRTGLWHRKRTVKKAPSWRTRY